MKIARSRRRLALRERTISRKDFVRFQKKIAYFGALSSLSQLALKITSPGIPDFYRGTEVWDLSLADPDNRRPVDFASRDCDAGPHAKDAPTPSDLLKNPGRRTNKTVCNVERLLNFRRAHEDLFREGEYLPLRVTGSRANHIIAFARRCHDQWCVVVVPRLPGKAPPEQKVWRDTVDRAAAEAGSQWTNILTDETFPGSFPPHIFTTLPVAVLTELSGGL